MAFSGTGVCWELGSATRVNIAGSWHSLVFQDTQQILLRNAYTQLHKLSTKQIVIFSPNTDQHPKQQCKYHHRNIPVSSHKLEKGILWRQLCLPPLSSLTVAIHRTVRMMARDFSNMCNSNWTQLTSRKITFYWTHSVMVSLLNYYTIYQSFLRS